MDTYKLELPVGLRLHPEFHTSLLKPYISDLDPERLNKPNEGMIAAGGFDDGYLVEKIINHKRVKDKVKVLAKWLGYPTDQNTWEPLGNLIKPARDLIQQYFDRRGLDSSEWLSGKTRRSCRR